MGGPSRGPGALGHLWGGVGGGKVLRHCFPSAWGPSRLSRPGALRWLAGEREDVGLQLGTFLLETPKEGWDRRALYPLFPVQAMLGRGAKSN